jgi:hypothetical protein
MKQSVPSKGENRSRVSTLVLIATGVVLLAAALFIGIGDNPPGLVLTYLAITAWILALAHRWRRLKSFLILLGASLIGFPLFSVLHNVFYALGVLASEFVVLSRFLGFLDVASFILSVLICPPGALIGAAGSVVMAISHLRGKRMTDDAS